LIGRLHRASDFERLRREGKRLRSGAIWCVMISDPTMSLPHVAFAIGRVNGSAVKRNRLRRQLREVVRSASGRLGPGLYLIGLTPFEQGKLPSFSRLASSVEGLLGRLESSR